jgi:hypothetical protein
MSGSLQYNCLWQIDYVHPTTEQNYSQTLNQQAPHAINKGNLIQALVMSGD